MGMEKRAEFKIRHTAIEGILIRSASRIGYFKTCPSLSRIVVKIQIRALVKAMMDRLRVWLIKVGVYICKAASSQNDRQTCKQKTEQPTR